MNLPRYFILLLFGVCLLASCQRKTTRDLTPPKVRAPLVDSLDTIEEEPSEEEPEIEPLADPIHLKASLRKTGCFGKCPSFEIKFFSDGRMTYRGYAFVNKVGIYEAWANPELETQIRNLAERHEFFRYEDQYPTDGHALTDLPSTISSLNLDGQEKVITNNFESPKGLRAFEKELWELLENREWKKVGGE